MECFITWKQIKDRVSKLDNTKKYYGVPRGGQPIAAMLNPVDTPEEADIIIDDLIDSGKTRKKFTKYKKPFIAIFDKIKEKDLKGKWLIFPWEVNEEIPVEENLVRILQYLGEDTTREGLQETPKRYIKFFTEFLNPPKWNCTTFESEGYDEMIVQTNIPFYSLCEHHLAPFFGHATIAYIPKKKIVGLSKLSRTLETYSRQLQNQERITMQVAEFLEKKLSPQGVAVIIKAKHLCMEMRGVKKHDTWTTTSIMKGIFKDDEKARNEVLLIHNNK